MPSERPAAGAEFCSGLFMVPTLVFRGRLSWPTSTRDLEANLSRTIEGNSWARPVARAVSGLATIAYAQVTDFKKASAPRNGAASSLSECASWRTVPSWEAIASILGRRERRFGAEEEI